LKPEEIVEESFRVFYEKCDSMIKKLNEENFESTEEQIFN
jgi:hypothetical protein